MAAKNDPPGPPVIGTVGYRTSLTGEGPGARSEEYVAVPLEAWGKVQDWLAYIAFLAGGHGGEDGGAVQEARRLRDIVKRQDWGAL